MKLARPQIALRALQFSLGVVLMGQAAALVFLPRAREAFAASGYPEWVRLLLAWWEICAAALFLWPRTLRAGAWALVLVLICAAGLHIYRGLFPPASYLIYIPAIFVVSLSRATR